MAKFRVSAGIIAAATSALVSLVGVCPRRRRLDVSGRERHRRQGGAGDLYAHTRWPGDQTLEDLRAVSAHEGFLLARRQLRRRRRSQAR